MTFSINFFLFVLEVRLLQEQRSQWTVFESLLWQHWAPDFPQSVSFFFTDCKSTHKKFIFPSVSMKKISVFYGIRVVKKRNTSVSCWLLFCFFFSIMIKDFFIHFAMHSQPVSYLFSWICLCDYCFFILIVFFNFLFRFCFLQSAQLIMREKFLFGGGWGEFLYESKKALLVYFVLC